MNERFKVARTRKCAECGPARMSKLCGLHSSPPIGHIHMIQNIQMPNSQHIFQTLANSSQFG